MGARSGRLLFPFVPAQHETGTGSQWVDCVERVGKR